MNKNKKPSDAQGQILPSSQTHSPWFQIMLLIVFGLGIFFRLKGLENKFYSHDEAYASLYAAGYLGNDVFAGIWDGKDKTVDDIQNFLKPSEDTDITESLSFMALYRPHQAPLFYLLAYYWIRFTSNTPASMRGLAAIFGFLSIPAFYWFSKELFSSSRLALLSIVFFTISPFHILFAQDARSYSLWTLATLLSSAALLWAIRKNNMISWLIYSLTLILGVYSHQLFVLVAIVHGFYFIGIHLLRYKNKYGGFLFAYLLALLAYAPWLFFLITRWQQVSRQVEVLNMRVPWYRYIQKWILNFSSPFIDLDFGSSNLIPYILRTLFLVLVAAALVFLLRHSSREEKTFLILIYIITTGALIVPDLLFGGIRSITGRYFVPANIATILVVANFLTTIPDQSPYNISGKQNLACLLLTISIFSNINILLAESWWNKELGRVNTEFVHEISKDQTLLIVSGSHPTNLGDVLLLSLAVDPDVHFRLYEDPTDIRYPNNYRNVYWFPSSYEEVKEISMQEQLQVRETISGVLWQIEGIGE